MKILFYTGHKAGAVNSITVPEQEAIIYSYIQQNRLDYQDVLPNRKPLRERLVLIAIFPMHLTCATINVSSYKKQQKQCNVIDTKLITGSNKIGHYDINNILFEYIKPNVITSIIKEHSHHYWNSLDAKRKHKLWDIVLLECEKINKLFNNRKSVQINVKYIADIKINITRKDIYEKLEPLLCKIKEYISYHLKHPNVDKIICFGQYVKCWYIQPLLAQMLRKYNGKIIYELNPKMLAEGASYISQQTHNCTIYSETVIMTRLSLNIRMSIELTDNQLCVNINSKTYSLLSAGQGV